MYQLQSVATFSTIGPTLRFFRCTYCAFWIYDRKSVEVFWSLLSWNVRSFSGLAAEVLQGLTNQQRLERSLEPKRPTARPQGANRELPQVNTASLCNRVAICSHESCTRTSSVTLTNCSWRKDKHRKAIEGAKIYVPHFRCMETTRSQHKELDTEWMPPCLLHWQCLIRLGQADLTSCETQKRSNCVGRER